jgi:hypothetical protein
MWHAGANDTVSITIQRRMVVRANSEYEAMWKEVVVAQFDVLFRHWRVTKDWGKLRESSVTIGGVHTEIRISYLLDIRQKNHHLNHSTWYDTINVRSNAGVSPSSSQCHLHKISIQQRHGICAYNMTNGSHVVLDLHVYWPVVTSRTATFNLTNHILDPHSVFLRSIRLSEQTLITSLTYSISQSQWPRGLRSRSTVTSLLRSWVRIPPGHGCLSVVCVVRYRSLRRADHSSRGVLPIVSRRCVWSRNLVNEEAIARAGLQSQRKENNKYIILTALTDWFRITRSGVFTVRRELNF